MGKQKAEMFAPLTLSRGYRPYGLHNLYINLVGTQCCVPTKYLSG